jgi:hypothetical protein
MKKEYETPEITMVEYNNSDIITLSGTVAGLRSQGITVTDVTNWQDVEY